MIATWCGYFQAIKEWSKHPGKFLGKPKIPKYKDKTKGRNLVIYSKESVYRASLKKGICHLSMSEIKIPVVVDTVVEVRIVPATGCYIIEVVYEKTSQPRMESTYVAGIDLGIDRKVALATNKPGVKPMLVNGKPLKSVNQLYNKRKAKYQSHLKGNRKTSRIY